MFLSAYHAVDNCVHHARFMEPEITYVVQKQITYMIQNGKSFFVKFG